MHAYENDHPLTPKFPLWNWEKVYTPYSQMMFNLYKQIYLSQMLMIVNYKNTAMGCRHKCNQDNEKTILVLRTLSWMTAF